MQDRQNQSVSRTALLAGAGVTGLAALFVVAPAAHAAPTPASDNADHGSKKADSSSRKAKADDATPDYGMQKYRVGVRGKDGDYYPDNTTTAGTKLHVVETGSDGVVDRTFDCTTVANVPNVVTNATFCPGELPPNSSRRAASVNEPSPNNAENSYYPQPGATVTITQTTVNDNMLKDTSTATLQPCIGNDGFGSECREPVPDSEGTQQVATDLIFVDPGIPPVAADDEDSTEEGVPVTIDIAPNDTPKAPIQSVEILSDPKDGTAKLLTSESTEMSRKAAGSRSLAAVTSYRAVYTPKGGFVGVDSFRYRITTANGTATATVRVTVTGTASESASASATTSASAVASASASTAASSNGRDPLAETGTQSSELVGYAAGLLAAGGGALALGRRRRRGRHAH